MIQAYAIIENDGGWLANTVMWDGNYDTWQPPEGTHAVPAEDVDIDRLPPRPE
jgi:hypothetical protein